MLRIRNDHSRSNVIERTELSPNFDKRSASNIDIQKRHPIRIWYERSRGEMSRGEMSLRCNFSLTDLSNSGRTVAGRNVAGRNVARYEMSAVRSVAGRNVAGRNGTQPYPLPLPPRLLLPLSLSHENRRISLLPEKLGMQDTLALPNANTPLQHPENDPSP